MSNKGNMLRVGDYLGPNEYLVSKNRAFFAIMQADGNFCVYKGDGPNNNHGLLWDTHTKYFGQPTHVIMQADANFCMYSGANPSMHGAYLWSATGQGRAIGNYFVLLQDDGNLCLYSGKGDKAPTTADFIWNTGNTDPWIDFTIDDVVYDVSKAVIKGTKEYTAHEWEVKDYRQEGLKEVWVSGEVPVTETMEWIDEYRFKIKIETAHYKKVPELVNGRVVMSDSLHKNFKWNDTTTRVTRFDAYIEKPQNFPPGYDASMGFNVKATLINIEVPYTITGKHTLASGAKIPATLNGLYKGAFMRGDLFAEISSYDDVMKWVTVYREPMIYKRKT